MMMGDELMLSFGDHERDAHATLGATAGGTAALRCLRGLDSCSRAGRRVWNARWVCEVSIRKAVLSEDSGKDRSLDPARRKTYNSGKWEVAISALHQIG